MFEVIRYRNRGEFTYQYTVIPYRTNFSPDEKKGFTPVIHRFGPFSTEEEALDFISEIEIETSDAPHGL